MLVGPAMSAPRHPHFTICTATSTPSLLGGTQGYYYYHCLTSDTLLHFSGSQGHKNRLERRQGVISPLLSSHEPAKAGCAGCHSSSRLRGALRRVETLEPGAEEMVWSRLQADQTAVITPISFLAICQGSSLCHHYLKRSLLYTR